MLSDFIIIESLNPDDEKNDRFEGRFLEKYLKLLHLESEYYYIRTRKELEYVAENMSRSKKTLFISCHGKEKNISTTLDEISFKDFAKIFSGLLNGKRVLGSFCIAGRDKFARALFNENEDMSCFIAPTQEVYFQSTYPFWAAFCSLLSEKKATVNMISNVLSVCSHLFGMRMAYYPNGWWKGKMDKPLLFEPDVISDDDCERYASLIKTVNDI